ncbi:hypothetical protein [uncultured Litoreibacter sp.]|uniref:hypothetical protein n=1 Tax=uncultured Litoreibacter sp. TaxID=1392394 RepID=UPI002627F2AC|nr:hypothetical protein [uncultured Litoreibacter sp.]
MAQVPEDGHTPDEKDQPKGQGRRRIGLTHTNTSSRSLFLERRVYQHRRLVDAAKMLPILGLFLFVIPALLLGTPYGDGTSGTTSVRLGYFFFVWLSLIATCAVIARGLTGADTPREDKPKSGGTRS